LAHAESNIESLDNHTAFLFDKINFLMDAPVGFININQNKIIKIFSVASVALLPPTLIASIYGMNFQYMPELNQTWGYPFAIFLMIGSAVIPMWISLLIVLPCRMLQPKWPFCNLCLLAGLKWQCQALCTATT
jgi:Mg2+ and Co2+ transporter CorA